MARKYTIRKMNENELQIALDWAYKEGWNPGLTDRSCFYQADPKGFFLGLLDDEPIATGAAVAYDNQFAFCGLYIVKPEFRNQGYGMQLTEKRLEYVGNRITGIDGVLANVAKYERIGYVPVYKNVRYKFYSQPSFSLSPLLVNLKTLPFKQLEEFDRNYFPAPRPHFLRCWIDKGEALGYIENQSLQGYGVIRQCFEGYKIGPLFAKSAKIAQILLESLCAQKIGAIYLDLPEPNERAKPLIQHYQMVPTFEVIRMYRNGVPQIDLQGVYGVTTYELG